MSPECPRASDQIWFPCPCHPEAEPTQTLPKGAKVRHQEGGGEDDKTRDDGVQDNVACPEAVHELHLGCFQKCVHAAWPAG